MTRTSAKSQIISRRVTRYETPDGHLHDTLTAARKHQVKRELFDTLRVLLIAPPYESDLEISYICNALLEKPGEIATLLRQFMQLEQIKVSKPKGVKPA